MVLLFVAYHRNDIKSVKNRENYHIYEIFFVSLHREIRNDTYPTARHRMVLMRSDISRGLQDGIVDVRERPHRLYRDR